MYLINDTLSTLLPFRIYMPDGSSRTCLNELTEAQLAELDIYPVDEIRPELLPAQYYGEPKITVSGGRATATYPVIDYSPTELSEMLAAAKEQKRTEIATARYEAEIAGVMGIKTDRESQSLLTAACLQAVIDPTYTLNWKTIDGTFVTMTAEQIKTVGSIVRLHVQGCFDEEARLCGLIDLAETKEEISAITWKLG